MSLNLIATRYAKALLTLAGSDEATADKYAMFLQTAAEMFDIPEAKKILKSPVMPSELKKDLLNLAKVKSVSGQTIEKSVEIFCDQLVSAGRVALLPEVKTAFNAMLDQRRGLARAVVTTATAISADESKDLQSALSSVFKKKISIDNKVNKKILGGVLVEVGNFAIDLSVKAKLESLSEFAQN